MRLKPLDLPLTRRGVLKYLGSAGAGLLGGLGILAPLALRTRDARAASGLFAASKSAASSGDAPGFLPDSGYGFSGVPAFDGSFTITDASNSFGSTGPTLALFDDFRKAKSGGNLKHNQAPVAGYARWAQNSGGDAMSPHFRRVNRGGANPAISILDDERAGGTGTGPFGRSARLDLGGHYTAIYVFYAEKWYGWDGRNDEGGGGGYYKHNWLLGDDSYGKTAFDAVLPVFVEACSKGPGSYGSNTACTSVNTLVTGNSWDAHGMPTTVYHFGDDNGLGKWDTEHWNSHEMAYVGDPSHPTTAPGIYYDALYNAANRQAFAYTLNKPLFSDTDPKFSYFADFQFLGLLQCVGKQTIDRADVYIAVGPNCLKRFFIGDAAKLADCTTLMPCTIDSWSAGSVTMTLRQGAFASPSGNHLYWSDAANHISHVGQFTGGTAATPVAPGGVSVK